MESINFVKETSLHDPLTKAANWRYFEEYANKLLKTAVREILNRIRMRVDAEMKARQWGVTLSVGAMVFSIMSSTIGSMLKSVDDLMYEVKKSGKNAIKIVEQVK